MPETESNGQAAEGSRSSSERVVVAPVEVQRQSSPFWSLRSARFQVVLMLCFFMLVTSLMRVTFGMAMVCMVNSTYLAQLHEDSAQFLPHNASANFSEKCRLTDYARNEYEGTMEWSTTIQSYLFSAMFWGGILTAIPAGWLADRYGPKHLLLLSCVLHIVGSVTTPAIAERTGYLGVFTIRFIMGLGQGLSIPAIGSTISRWYPPVERSTVLAIYTAGNQMASITGNPLSAYFCEQKWLFGGWPTIFYFCGGFAVLWCIVWAFLVTNSPEKHRRISVGEKGYLVRTLSGQLDDRKYATKHIPWKSMFHSRPVYACAVVNFSVSFLISVFQSYLPTYFKDVLLVDLKSNGLFSALPFLCQWAMKMILAPVADHLKKTTNLDHTLICKVFNSIGSFGCAATLAMVGFVSCENGGLAVVLLCVSFGCFSAFIPGFMTSIASIAPAYTGIVNSFCRLSAQSGAIAGPYVVGWFTIAGNTQAEWRLVFLTISGLLTATGIFFLFFGSADLQTWAMPRKESMQQGFYASPSGRTLTTADGTQLHHKAAIFDTSVPQIVQYFAPKHDHHTPRPASPPVPDSPRNHRVTFT